MADSVQPVAGEFLVNTSTEGQQSGAVVTSLAGGGLVVAWLDRGSSEDTNPDQYLRAQVLSADGTPVGSEFVVATKANDMSAPASITQLADGSICISWPDAQTVKAQIFATSGDLIGGELNLATSPLAQGFLHELKALPGGGFVLAWTGTDGPNPTVDSVIKAQLFDSSGASAGAEITVSGPTGNYPNSPSVAVSEDGSFVVTWDESIGSSNGVSHLSSDSDVKARLFAANGAPLAGEFMVNVDTTNHQSTNAVAALDGGGFVVTWTDESSGDRNISARIYSADGAPAGDSFVVNSITEETQHRPEVVGLEGGGFIVTWEGGEIWARAFAADGTPLGDDFQVNTQTDSIQQGQEIAVAGDGRFVITWADRIGDGSSSGVKAQLFAIVGEVTNELPFEGTPTDLDTEINVGDEALDLTGSYNVNAMIYEGSSGPDQLVMAGTNDFLVLDDGIGDSPMLTEIEEIQAGDGNDVVVLQSDRFAYGDVVIDGGAGDDFLAAGDGDDTLLGDTGNDTLIGGSGGDGLDGGTDNDRLVGGEGDDTLDGGEGDDTAVFSGARNDYAVTWDGEAYTVTDLRGVAAATFAARSTGLMALTTPVPTGTDTVRNVEWFVFGGVTFAASALLNTPPSIISDGGGDAAEITLAENTKVVTTVSALDPDAGQSLTYSISGGSDAGRFGIDPITGELSFLSAPDFETPSDADADNVYEVEVGVSDGQASDVQLLTVTIANQTGVTIIGTLRNDLINASSTVPGKPLPTGEEDTIRGGNGNDTIDGLGGNDTLFGDDGNDTLRGGDGSDHLDGGRGRDQLHGGAGDDIYALGNERDDVFDAAGNDTITSTVSRNLMSYGAVEHLVLMGNGNIDGTGNGKANTITGNGGKNVLDGAGGVDTLAGGAGSDTYILDGGSDAVIDSGGADDAITSTISRDLGDYAGIERLILTGSMHADGTGTDGSNDIFGNAGRNLLSGKGGHDRLSGGRGNDTLVGGEGNDRLDGEPDSDILIGGTGQDTMSGGSGADRFVFEDVSDSIPLSADIIADFAVRSGDRIDVSALYAGALAYRGTGGFTGAGQVRVSDVSGPDVVVEVNLGGSLAADFAVRLKNVSANSLSAGDFML
ncbi:MAG TPA: cadherin domain-containing protein [Rhizobiaceae bacterium]|nr:cadherin domain-containing protein [Rhizobiaceae bacterium]